MLPASVDENQNGSRSSNLIHSSVESDANSLLGRYYVPGLLTAKDRTENAAALRIPAAEIKPLVSDGVHRCLLDPGSMTNRLPRGALTHQYSTVSRGPQRSASTGPSCRVDASPGASEPAANSSNELSNCAVVLL
jgi:hypothetical protein